MGNLYCTIMSEEQKRFTCKHCVSTAAEEARVAVGKPSFWSHSLTASSAEQRVGGGRAVALSHPSPFLFQPFMTTQGTLTLRALGNTHPFLVEENSVMGDVVLGQIPKSMGS